jgi:phosphoglycolate phosphatase
MRVRLEILSLLILLASAVASRINSAFIERVRARRQGATGDGKGLAGRYALQTTSDTTRPSVRVSLALDCRLWQEEETATDDSGLAGFDISSAKVIVFDKDGTLGSDKGTLKRWALHMTSKLEECAKEYISGSTYPASWTVQSIKQNFHQCIGWDPIKSEVLPSAPLAAGTWQDQIEKLQGILEVYQLDSSGGSLASSWHNSVQLHGADKALIPNLPEMLQDCRSRDLLVAVCTSDERQSTDAALEYWGVDHLMSYSICADEVDNPKPAAEPLERLCAHISRQEGATVTPQDCIVVGDTTGDTGMAQNANALLCVGVLTGSGTEKILCATGADIILPSVAQIPALLSVLGRRIVS